MQAKNDNHLWGIDVSKYQGIIDWPEVAAAGVQFAFIKVSEGTGYADSLAQRNAEGAKAAGILIGYYHYAHPELNPAKTETRWYLQTISKLPVPDLPCVLDLEGNASRLKKDHVTEWAYQWLDEINEKTNHPVMIYTGASFAKDYLGPKLYEFPLWVAHYGVDQPMDNSTWDEWSIFQYSDQGSCPGIIGAVDMNLMEPDFMEIYYEKNQQESDPEESAFEFEEIEPEKKTAFDDVPAGHWAEDSIAAAARAGIMTGMGDGALFAPNEPLTRAQAAKIVNDILWIIDQK